MLVKNIMQKVQNNLYCMWPGSILHELPCLFQFLSCGMLRAWPRPRLLWTASVRCIKWSLLEPSLLASRPGLWGQAPAFSRHTIIFWLSHSEYNMRNVQRSMFFLILFLISWGHEYFGEILWSRQETLCVINCLLYNANELFCNTRTHKSQSLPGILLVLEVFWHSNLTEV